jgi:uridine phosphorylase
MARLGAPMPARLRPTAPIAADAILVGDPGRALLLAQALLNQPKMSNHARGLWGYSGRTAAGRPLTLQATGMGGPSAALVLADLVELGVRRAIRVGTCTALDPALRLGQLLAIERAHAWGGPGAGGGATALPDAALTERLRGELGSGGRTATVASLDTLHTGDGAPAAGCDVADMQTAALFGRGADLGIAVAGLLIVTATGAGAKLEEEEEGGKAAKQAGAIAGAVLSG